MRSSGGFAAAILKGEVRKGAVAPSEREEGATMVRVGTAIFGERH